MSINSRKTKAQPIGEAIEAFLEAFKLKPKLNETQLISRWNTLMGASIAQRTEKIYINKGVLFLRISSAPLCQELILAKSKIIALLNAEIGEEVIKDIVFI